MTEMFFLLTCFDSKNLCFIFENSKIQKKEILRHLPARYIYSDAKQHDLYKLYILYQVYRYYS